jgi:hypothetical protein
MEVLLEEKPVLKSCKRLKYLSKERDLETNYESFRTKYYNMGKSKKILYSVKSDFIIIGIIVNKPLYLPRNN